MNQPRQHGRFTFKSDNPLLANFLAHRERAQQPPPPEPPDLNGLLRLIASGKATPILRPVIDGTEQPTPNELLRQLANLKEN